jgi:hypothetical protein
MAEVAGGDISVVRFTHLVAKIRSPSVESLGYYQLSAFADWEQDGFFVANSLLITHYSSLITHHSLLITHYSSLITHHSLLITVFVY